MASWGVVAALAFVCTVVHAPDAEAAGEAGPRARSFELSGSVLWLGGSALGAPNATLTPNLMGNFPRVTLFKTDSRLQSSVGYGVRLTFNITRVLAAEAGISRSHPSLRIGVSGDADGAPPVTLSGDRHLQYLVDASLVAHLTGLSVGSRAIPFLVVGAGHLRQLYAGSVLVETGSTLHAGGGVKYFARTRSTGFLRGVGVRADVRAYVRSRRLDFADKARVVAAAGVGGFLAF